jgi:hypothetical protein
MSARDYSLHRTLQRIRIVAGKWAIQKSTSGLPVLQEFLESIHTKPAYQH